MADKLGIGLRAYQSLEEKGTTRYERCEELGRIFEIDPRWIWDGREKGDTPDPFTSASPDQLTRIESKLDQILCQLEDR